MTSNCMPPPPNKPMNLTVAFGARRLSARRWTAARQMPGQFRALAYTIIGFGLTAVPELRAVAQAGPATPVCLTVAATQDEAAPRLPSRFILLASNVPHGGFVRVDEGEVPDSTVAWWDSPTPDAVRIVLQAPRFRAVLRLRDDGDSLPGIAQLRWTGPTEALGWTMLVVLRRQNCQ